MYASTGSVTLSAPANARRVTVVAPTTRVDVALPAESAIAEIVPQLAGLAALQKDSVERDQSVESSSRIA